MKQIVNKITLAAAVAAMLFTTACNDDDTNVLPSKSSAAVVNIPFFVETETGELPSDASSLLYETRESNPVFAPDGTHVTWGDFSKVVGEINTQCTYEGTKLTMNLSGLIPNGVYTIWNVTVSPPGFDPSEADMNISGIGAAGNGEGEDNVLIASANGTGSITLLSPGGDLSMFGNIEPCSIADEYEWHVVGTYHIDGKTYGRDLGPDGTVAEQFGFIFKQDQ